MSPAADWDAGGPGAGPAGDVDIDRLALHVAGIDEDAALELARLVAEGLAPGLLRSGGVAGLSSVQIEVSARSGEQGQPTLLARRIIDEIGRVLARERAPGGEAAS
jgi:hypothetical protein